MDWSASGPRWYSDPSLMYSCFVGSGKWGTWSAGLASTWQVPVACTADAAWKYFSKDLVTR